MGRVGAVSAVLLVWVAGCCRSVPPRDLQEAMFRVNDNLSRIHQPVYYAAWVSFKFRDGDRKLRHFPAHDATLIFHAPRSLLLNIKQALAGVIAQFGSNDEQYWLWIEPEVRKLWRGDWAEVNQGSTRKLAIPPDELLDALMLRPLPERLEGGRPPELHKRGFHYWLVFQRVGAGGQPLGVREIKLDRCEPYQPREIIDRLPDGRVIMHAKLKRYRRIGPDGPHTARHYVVRWPLDEAELRLDILRAKFRPDLSEEVFDTPVWQGEIEYLDAPSAGVSRAAAEGIVQP